MYKKPDIFIIRKDDMMRIKAMASSMIGGCFASGACSGNIDKAGTCTSTTDDNAGKDSPIYS
jgi:hypothetical protein